MDLKVVELFAGVGGFRVGLNNINEFDNKTGLAIENGDWEFVWANQWEPSTKIQPAFDCYTTRFGLDNHSNVDINKVDKTVIPNHSLLVGGFPCQDYSVARSLSNEMGIKGKKGVLWWDIVDVILEKKPPFILLENVDRLLKSPSKQRGRDFAVMLKTLEELDYIVQWRMINSGLYNMPQRRRRIFIFASRKGTKYSRDIINLKDKEKYLIENGFFNEIFPVEKFNASIKKISLEEFNDAYDVSENYNEGKFLTSGIFVDGKVLNFDVIEIPNQEVYSLRKLLEISKNHNQNIEEYIIKQYELDKWKYLKGSKRIERKRPDGSTYFYSEGSMNFPEDLDSPSRTMLTSESTLNRSSHVIYDKNIDKIRRITEVEAELLQMFPPNWTNTGMSKRNRYFMMGNALVTGVIEKIGNKLKDIILNE